MIKDIVLQHQLEKERLLSKDYIPREKLDFAKKFLKTELIKVITGPRRSGKSVFSFLLLRNEKFAYIDFDDEKILKIKDYDEILKGILEVYREFDFILFDEIQNLENWEIFVNKLQRRGYNLILTGSNAKLLSKELSTVLTGRYIPIDIFPFSFREFLNAKKLNIEDKYLATPEVRGKLLNYLDEYLKNGGFPEVVIGAIEPKSYLDTLFDSILLKDVVKRYKIRFTQKIYNLALYLISNFSSEFSFNKLKTLLDFRSTNTVESYLNYLEEAYIVFSLNRFSFKAKEQIKAPRKIYLIDNGFVFAKSFQFSQNVGKLMENLVFVEILRRGYGVNKDVFYYKTKSGKEIDFILREGFRITKLIQVCFEINDMKVKEREINALIEASEELNCDDLLIITWDTEKEEKIKGKKIKFIPLWKWLLEKTLDS
jgi:predicted AAA+ superfamily ATPase